MTGYDKKTLTLSSDIDTAISVEIDITGVVMWQPWRTLEVKQGTELSEVFPKDLKAYWVRFSSAKDATVSAQLNYE